VPIGPLSLLSDPAVKITLFLQDLPVATPLDEGDGQVNYCLRLF
jgi:hypothetical protein